VKQVFSEVPNTYELTNHVLTLGFDILWRKKTAKIAAKSGGSKWVDMCTGTGETATYLSQLAPKGTKVLAVDFSPEMLTEARKKSEAKKIEFITSDIKELPFLDASIDVITISFATRNINLNKDILIESFSEFYRVLKSGGLFVNLETSQPSCFLIRKLFHLYIKLFVKQVGSRISSSKAGYSYLSKTIPKFYSAPDLADILKQSGFNEITYSRMLFGVAAIHQARKK
jgi:demethylmenaquinone methyltransferase / 2-methoxy-6-polyprenyl-1,4-benzoquinol methylase